jgi:hypothetical protein
MLSATDGKPVRSLIAHFNKDASVVSLSPDPDHVYEVPYGLPSDDRRFTGPEYTWRSKEEIHARPNN